MKGANFKKWLKAAIIRAIKTFAETAAAGLAVWDKFEFSELPAVLSAAGLAALIALLTCIAGLPEVDNNE